MVSINHLTQGRKYIFYEKRTMLHNEECYRGRFLETREISPFHKYIYIVQDNNEKFVTITPVKWITKVESLDDILGISKNLPSDVIGVIDEFL
jgi:hypothetical protein